MNETTACGDPETWYRKQIRMYEGVLSQLPKRDSRRNGIYDSLRVLRYELATLHDKSATRETVQEVLSRFVPEEYGEW